MVGRSNEGLLMLEAIEVTAFEQPTALGVSPRPPAGDKARPPHPLRIV
jgi:hypothetical protein